MAVTSDFRSTPEWIQGDAAQRQAADLLRGQKWYVIPSYDYSGEEERAPRLEGLDDAFPIPDLDCAKQSHRIWVEVKSKTGASWGKWDFEWQHGINKRLFESYCTVQQITGCPVYLLIHEKNTARHIEQELAKGGMNYPSTEPAWLTASLEAIADEIRPRKQNRMVKNGRPSVEMVYFPRSVLKPRFRTLT